MAPWIGSAPNMSTTRTDGVRTGSEIFQEQKAAPVNIRADLLDVHAQDLSVMINECLRKDGGNYSADADLNGQKFTDVGVGTARTHFAALSQVQDSTVVYAGTSAGTDTITATLSPAITAYLAGQRYHFKAGGTNTGAATVNFNSVGAKDIKKGAAGSTALVAGDITTGGVYSLIYDGTAFQIENPGAGVLAVANGGTGQATIGAAAEAFAQAGAGFGDEVDVASASTVDLGLIATHNVQVTGTTTITAFGSSADTDTPLYWVKFGGAMIVTHNATSLVMPGLVNYTTSAGDCMLCEYIGSGNWRVRAIMPRNAVGYRTVAGGILADAVFPGALVAIIEDNQTSGTAAQTMADDADTVRTLQTLVYNRNTTVTLSSNRFTLPAGTWEIEWIAPVGGGSIDALHQSFLYNQTDSSEVKRGTPGHLDMGDSDDGDSQNSNGHTVVTIAGAKAFEIRHRVNGLGTVRGGDAASLGTEVYARVIVRAA